MRPVARILRQNPFPSCTCRYATYSSSSQPAGTVYSSPLQSTSKPTFDPCPSYESLLPPSTRLPFRKLSSRQLRKSRRRTLKATDSSSPPLRDHAPTSNHLLQISPYLPLVTRERNYLLSSLLNEIYAPQRDVDRTWEALARVVQYPARVPQLPPAHRPSAERTQTEDDLEGPTTHRNPIQLSLRELRRTFSVLASSRPRTRTGLSRLLVVVELIAAQTSLQPLPPGERQPPDPRALDLQNLRGGGIGLTNQNWYILIQFAALSYRSPRKTHEVATATSLFSQWKKLKDPKDTDPPEPSAEMYNALLSVATRAKAWDLVDALMERMGMDKIKQDAYATSLRIRFSDKGRVHAQSVWEKFEEAFLNLTPSDRVEKDFRPLWNAVIAALAEREQLEDAHRIYIAMRLGKRVALHHLRPSNVTASSSFHVKPPVPDVATYESLIRAYTLKGDLERALTMFKDMATPSVHRRLIAYLPTPNTFAAFFRGFAMHGVPPLNHPSSSTDPHLHHGRLERSTSPSLGMLTPGQQRKLESTPSDSPWTLTALKMMFRAFLCLKPTALDSSLSYGGSRSAPSSRQLFWLILAFERLSGSDSRVVVEMWDTVVQVFKHRPDPRREAKVWRGWYVDQRVFKRIEEHRKLAAQVMVEQPTTETHERAPQ